MNNQRNVDSDEFQSNSRSFSIKKSNQRDQNGLIKKNAPPNQIEMNRSPISNERSNGEIQSKKPSPLMVNTGGFGAD